MIRIAHLERYQKNVLYGRVKVYKPQDLPEIYEEYRKGLITRNPKGNRDL